MRARARAGDEPDPAEAERQRRSQVVVNGRVWKTLSAREYYAHVDELRPHVLDAYADLARRFDVVVIEGAGSVTRAESARRTIS